MKKCAKVMIRPANINVILFFMTLCSEFFLSFTMTAFLKLFSGGAATPAADQGNPSMLLPNIPGHLAIALKQECIIKQSTLECLICVL